MRCPDCKKDVGFNKVYCPHCSGELSALRHKKVAQPVYFLGVAL